MHNGCQHYHQFKILSSAGELEEQCQELAVVSWSALVSQSSVATANLGSNCIAPHKLSLSITLPAEYASKGGLR